MVGPQLHCGGRSCITDRGRAVRHTSVIQGYDHLIMRGQIPADNACTDHFTVAQNRRAIRQSTVPSQIGPGGMRDAVRNFNHATRMDQPRDQRLHTTIEPVQIGLGLNGGKAGRIDGLRVFFVGTQGEILSERLSRTGRR